MDPHLLSTFVTVARTGSFSAAAQELGYTQSAVSQQIAALESDLGATLLHRRPVAPTDAGARLLEHAGPILLRLSAARADVTRLSGQPAATVVLGATPFAGSDRVAAVLASVQRAMPRVRFTLLLAGRDAVAAGVATGTLDVGLVDGVTAPSDPLPLPDAGQLSASVLAQSAAVAAFPMGHPFAGRRSLRLADLADATWIDAPDVATPLPQLRALAHAGGFRAGLRYPGTDTGGLLALVAAGAGLALLPAPLSHPGVMGVEVTQPRLVHRVELVHGSLTPPARALAEAFAG
ncbi:LysR family transcriptional regulator [Dactylosporangium sp. NBC_01737]|uniref:LysR family transcriptional regulator n=1 Tax=Dactylosporangium sp. NBC_01737 TaxID=2975959 RepID=UPI002E113968|nr:LysR family transcriptional regulator [Dactylosporangium sp. NBC_01737]